MYMHTYIRSHTYPWMNAHTYTIIYTHNNIHTITHTHAYTCMFVICMNLFVCVIVCTYEYVYVNVNRLCDYWFTCFSVYLVYVYGTSLHVGVHLCEHVYVLASVYSRWSQATFNFLVRIVSYVLTDHK